MNTEFAAELTEKEYAVITAISSSDRPGQREIAHKAGISLGLANLLIKKMIGKGYVKAAQLDKKKIQYILTPRGFSEKAKKSYQFTIKTINMLKNIERVIQELIIEKYKAGADRIVVSGHGELFILTEMALKNIKDLNIDYAPVTIDQGKLFIDFFSNGIKTNSIDLIDHISKEAMYY